MLLYTVECPRNLILQTDHPLHLTADNDLVAIAEREETFVSSLDAHIPDKIWTCEVDDNNNITADLDQDPSLICLLASPPPFFRGLRLYQNLPGGT